MVAQFPGPCRMPSRSQTAGTCLTMLEIQTAVGSGKIDLDVLTRAEQLQYEDFMRRSQSD